MYRRASLIAFRLGFGVTTLVAILVQALRSHTAGVFIPANFFSYFTNLSNIFAAIVLIISALRLLARRRPTASDDLIRGAATLYMAVTGVVYAALLSGEDVGLLLGWVNVLLHYLMPIAVIVDWLYQPPGSMLRAKQLPVWFIFPLGYLLYSLIRGPIAHWYPYPFLNPDKAGGYGGVGIYCMAILVAFLLLGWLLMQGSNLLRRKQQRSD